MNLFVTGVAGFIGFHFARRMLSRGHRVVGLDSLNAYYDVGLKRARLAQLRDAGGDFEFVEGDIVDRSLLERLAREHGFDRVVHLAAQAGVRHSIDQPFDYAQANLVGHLSVLEMVRNAPEPPLLIYASSSSVYGNSRQTPFSELTPLTPPASLYAATKQADEMMSGAYANLYGLDQIGVRFFTVYGPWGRPDMAYWIFASRILKGEPIRVFNEGQLQRDFTYIDDVVGALEAMVTQPSTAEKRGRHRIYNVGNNRPVGLMDFISRLEEALGRKAELLMEPMQPGDVEMTCADISLISEDYGWAPSTRLADGLKTFADWYKTQFQTV